MIAFGKTLREAREAKGLTTNQLAETTKLLVQIVEDLEIENFNRIPAPIYGRGFVKLYCEAVDLDPKPLIEEFMAIYCGHREPVIRTREPATPPITKPDFTDEKKAINEIPSVPKRETVGALAPESDLFAAASEPLQPQPSILKAPAHWSAQISDALPRIPWRLVVLIIGIIALGYLMVCGFSALFDNESTAAAPVSQSEAIAEQTPIDQSAPAKPKVKRAYTETKPLYID